MGFVMSRGPGQNRGLDLSSRTGDTFSAVISAATFMMPFSLICVTTRFAGSESGSWVICFSFFPTLSERQHRQTPGTGFAVDCNLSFKQSQSMGTILAGLIRNEVRLGNGGCKGSPCRSLRLFFKLNLKANSNILLEF